MDNMEVKQTINSKVFTCRDCRDFYDCRHELEHNNCICNYFVKKYERICKIETVGDLIQRSNELNLKRLQLKELNK